MAKKNKNKIKVTVFGEIDCSGCGASTATPLQAELDWGGCYYEGDQPEITIKAKCPVCKTKAEVNVDGDGGIPPIFDSGS